MRRIGYFAEDLGKRMVFLTNNFDLPSLTIAELYRKRWDVELFFKWIKQYRRLKAFYGYSPNAVKTQVWIAVCVYLLVAIMRKQLRIQRSMGDLLQILSLSLFEKERISPAFFDKHGIPATAQNANQLQLFEL